MASTSVFTREFEPFLALLLSMASGAHTTWGAISVAYVDLHRISYNKCIDMDDYVGKLRTAHYRLSNMGLEIPEKHLVYILLGGLGIEFDSWISTIRKDREPPSFDSLVTDLVENFKHKAKSPVRDVRKTQKYTCNHCGLDHPSDNCYHLFS